MTGCREWRQWRAEPNSGAASTTCPKFSDRQMELLDHLRGELGESDADVVRSIVLAWLAEKSFISTVVKTRLLNERHEGSSGE